MAEETGSEGSPQRLFIEQGDCEAALCSLDQIIAEEPRNNLRYREAPHLHLDLGQTQQRGRTSTSQHVSRPRRFSVAPGGCSPIASTTPSASRIGSRDIAIWR